MVLKIAFRAGLVMMMLGCTIKPPDVIVTTERTALENQLLGSSEKVSDDPLSVAALWSVPDAYEKDFPADSVAPAERGSEGKRRLILAQIRRQTLQDYIMQLKRDGLLGEGRDGLLKVMADTIPQYEAVERIASAENEDRTVIMEFYAGSRGQESERQRDAVRLDFALLMARVSPTGTWVEDPESGWRRK